MAARRKNPTSDFLEWCSKCEGRFVSLEERQKTVDRVEDSLTAVVAGINSINVQLAKLPTWEDLSKVTGRVEILEKDKASLFGSWKAVVTVATVLSTVIGWALSYFLK